MRICCLNVALLPKRIVAKTIISHENFFSIAEGIPIEWIERENAENDPHYKQIIPYMIAIAGDGKIACYARHGTESRLHNLYSCGIGGHIEEVDKRGNFQQTVEAGLMRELNEEFLNFNKEKVLIEYRGFINEVESETGLVHLGIVYSAKCKDGYEPLAAEELKGMEWKTVEDVKQCKTELWTQLSLNLIYDGR